MKDDAESLVKIRGFLPGDEAFVYSTWLDGLFYGNDFFQKLLDAETYYRKYRKIIEYILAKPGVQVRVACLREDEDTICGYAVLETAKDGRILHWTHCKKNWRRLGIASDLIPKDIRAVTHLSELGRELKPKAWAYDPYLI